jgi:hypothetical protein
VSALVAINRNLVDPEGRIRKDSNLTRLCSIWLLLEYLALDWNALTGEVPSTLYQLSGLRTLILARNVLRGTIPDELCQRSMDFLAADCDEVSCACCDLCCVNGQRCAST